MFDPAGPNYRSDPQPGAGAPKWHRSRQIVIRWCEHGHAQLLAISLIVIFVEAGRRRLRLMRGPMAVLGSLGTGAFLPGKWAPFHQGAGLDDCQDYNKNDSSYCQNRQELP